MTTNNEFTILTIGQTGPVYCFGNLLGYATEIELVTFTLTNN